MKTAWLISSVCIFITACFPLHGLKQKEFVYFENEQRKVIKLEIPAGYKDEKIYLMAAGGKEIRYNYPGGAVLYFSYGVTWPSVNQESINKEISNNRFRHEDDRIVFRGQEQKSKYWKEIQLEDFRFGYWNVTKSKITEFEHAVNALYVR